ncbi:MAG: hypothetical protein KatS3mg108_3172 [Isosphaeraceae bacterium]|nr:MAG: hypothetical protein KatS3mg108_3172 [Isosphaeraceae bacterium]
MSSNPYLVVFALAFMGCVLAIPVVTRLAGWLNAIDRPDQFRRIHRGSIPRLGGLGLACGLACGLGLASLWAIDAGNPIPGISSRHLALAGSALLILLIGVVDDTRGLSPRTKLLGQTVSVLVLYAGGIRIAGIEFLGYSIPLSYSVALPLPGLGFALTIDAPSLTVTLLWFLGCMNVWNLIDGMDGLASGVGLLVCGTLLLVAIYHDNLGSALLAAALGGSLAGFLLYNWHPACIFLGDCGSLLMGLTIGVIGVLGSLKGTTAVALLFPVLAMGLPITDTAMAIFRRWVRDLPLSAADRRHIHHLLIGLGLTPRQAAVVLYFFTAGLCGIVLLGVAWRNEMLALLLGTSGCAAFLLVLTSRRDELSQLVVDLRERRRRRRQERMAARITWETIQRIELASDPDGVAELVAEAALAVGAWRLELVRERPGVDPWEYDQRLAAHLPGKPVRVQFSIGCDADRLQIRLDHPLDSAIDADIALRAVQRLAQAAAQRFRVLDPASDGTSQGVVEREDPALTPAAYPRGRTLEASGWGLAAAASGPAD